MKQKKILLIGVGLAGIMFPAWAQYESITVGNSCSYFGETMPDSVISFQSDAEAELIIENILKQSSLNPDNFEVHVARVPNAAAVVQDGKRYILYNQSFMRDMRIRTGSKWAAISIMAHEIGHHLEGHTLDSDGSRPYKELEADRFSGAVVHKLGGSVGDARLAIEAIGSDDASLTHPAKRNRLAAINNGYFESKEHSSGKRSGGTSNNETASRDPDIGVDSRCKSEGEWIEQNEIKFDARGYVLDSKRCEEWTFEFHDGSRREGNYKNDKKDGWWVEIVSLPDGEIRKEGKYKGDKRDGIWSEISIFSDGKLVQDGRYKDDKKNGYWAEVYINDFGERWSTGAYKNGKKDDKWTMFTTMHESDKTFMKTEIYQYGRLLETATREIGSN